MESVLGRDGDFSAVVEKTRELIETNLALRAALAYTRARAREVATSKLLPLRGGAEAAPESAKSDEASLRARVRACPRSGLLPTLPSEVWAGVGTGALCSVCESAIPLTDVEYEVARAGQRFFAHVACFMVWREESARNH